MKYQEKIHFEFFIYICYIQNYENESYFAFVFVSFLLFQPFIFTTLHKQRKATLIKEIFRSYLLIKDKHIFGNLQL